MTKKSKILSLQLKKKYSQQNFLINRTFIKNNI